jgi:hypothetical protein
MNDGVVLIVCCNLYKMMLNKQLSDDSFILRIQVMTRDITIYFMRSITLIVIIMNLYCSFGRTYNIE